MITHRDIYNAIDKITEETGLSRCALCKKAKLDLSSLNKAREYRKDGKEQWMSVKTLVSILNAIGKDFTYFANFVDGKKGVTNG